MSALHRRLAIAFACVAAMAGSGCSGASQGPSVTAITVGAASSLTDVLGPIGVAFETANPGTTVTFSYAASSAVAEQVRSGAPIDVFTSAGITSMGPVAAEGLVTGVADFAANSLMIATPPGNPAGVAGLADLARVTLVVCDRQAPCGAATAALLERNAVPARPASLEPDVRSVLTKVEADEADAGIVYVTDVRAAGDRVVGVPIPADANVSTTYQAAVVAASRHQAAAAAFVDFLQGSQAQALLAAAGFAPAP